MKLTNSNRQIIIKPELSKADTADNLAGKKKSVQKSGSKVAVAQSAAIKSDTVQLSQKSIALARAAKSNSGDNVTETEKVVTSAPRSGSRAEDTNKQIKSDGKTQTNTVQNADKRSAIFGFPSKSLQEILSDEFNDTESLESAIDHFGQYNVILA